VRAFEAGNDLVLDPPEPDAALDALLEAARAGRLPPDRIDRAVGRILAIKERLGLPVSRAVDLARVPDLVGGRASGDVARVVAERAVTAVRSAALPLAIPRTGTVLHLSALDYPGNWRVSAPGRTFVAELRARFPNTTAVEVSDRSSRGELDLLRATASQYDAIVVGVYVRAASGSGRLQLAPEVAALLNDLGKGGRPVVACLFGNPYVAADLPSVGSLLLTFDLGDNAELAAVRAIAGEIPATGTLPITLAR
jgi:beta-N-acetylhexosaminidase